MRRNAVVAGSLVVVCAMAAPAAAYDWLQFNGDAQHGGNNVAEVAIDHTNVGQLALRYQIALPAAADSIPVFLEAVATAGGTRDLLFVTTRAGHLLALDARTGAQVWSKQYDGGACKINNGSNACYTTSSPAIDPSRLHVYGYGLDGSVHKYRVGDGVEITTGGWPQLVTTKGFDEKASGALATAVANGTRYLYVVTGGYPGDNGDYQGHVTAIDLASGTQKVFNAMCSDKAMHFDHNDANCAAVRSAVWSRPGVIYHAGTGRIYFGTGNGSYNGSGGGKNWSESVLAIAPDGSGSVGKPLDSYTPSNFQALDNADADLGSTAPAILPVPAASRVQNLAVQGGKDALLRLIDLADLSRAGGPGHVGGEVGSPISVPQGGVVLSQPAVWTNPADLATWVFVANGNGISGLRLSIDGSGNPSLVLQWQKAGGGFSPLVANNVLYYAGSNALRALDPTTGNPLWSNAQIAAIHWQSPMVGNSMVYVLDQAAHLTAYALPLATSGGTPQSARVGAAFGAPLSVKLVDAANNPVANATVAWSVPAQGARATLAAATSMTDAQGVATMTATASAVAGKYPVMAKSGTLAAAFELRNTLASVAGTGCTLPNGAVNDLIEQYYQGILGRPSEAKAYWVSEVARLCALGVDPEQTLAIMASLFFDGAEYRGKGKTDLAYATDLDAALLGRLPRVGEAEGWAVLLQQGLPRRGALASFVFSAEFEGILDQALANAAARAEVYTIVDLYGGALSRLPESGGLTYWVGRMRQAQCQSGAAVLQAFDDMTRQFFAGPEYQARGRTNGEYVTDLYFGLLRRGAEFGGFDYWRGKLDIGALTREQVRAGFFASPETQGIAAAMAAEGCAP